ncbi:MAG: amino acid ABC transporter permease [Erysipelotrichaceae bacterium]
MKTESVNKKILNGFLVLLCIGGFLFVSAKLAGIPFSLTHLWNYRVRFMQGFVLTIEISLFSMLVSLLIGLAVALGRQSKVLFLRYLCTTYVELIRGTPLLVQIIFFYYVIGTAWGVDNRFISGVLILSIFEGAYISEILRGGFNSIELRQYEIARAIGLTREQTFRYVIVPQLTVRVLPALAGQFASVIKDSSLLSTIAVIELMQVTKEITANNFAVYFESYLLLALLYLCLTFPVSLLSKALERRFKYEY